MPGDVQLEEAIAFAYNDFLESEAARTAEKANWVGANLVEIHVVMIDKVKSKDGEDVS